MALSGERDRDQEKDLCKCNFVDVAFVYNFFSVLKASAKIIAAFENMLIALCCTTFHYNFIQQVSSSFQILYVAKVRFFLFVFLYYLRCERMLRTKKVIPGMVSAILGYVRNYQVSFVEKFWILIARTDGSCIFFTRTKNFHYSIFMDRKYCCADFNFIKNTLFCTQKKYGKQQMEKSRCLP